MRRIQIAVLAVLLAAVAVLAACGGSQQTQSQVQTTPSTANVYVTGSDAPLPAVLAFQVNISSLTLSNGTSTYTLEDPGSIDFSRLLGLRTLLSLGQVPQGTYTSAQVTLASPVITYLDMSANPPAVRTMNGTLLNNTVTLALNPALTIGSSGLGGLHFHFDIRNSLLTDANGQITGQVSPQIQMRALAVGDADAEIDELRGAVASVDVNGSSFVLQRLHGRQVTIRVNNQTQWQGTDSLNTIAPPSTVEVSGTIQADGSLLADSVEVLTHDAAFLGGLIINVNPATGDATDLSLLVREEMPVLAGITVPGSTTLNLGTNSVFAIRDFHLPVSSFLFNRSMLVAGQRVAVGGVVNTATTPNTLDVRRVVLRRQGVDGVPGSIQVTNGNTGTFTLANNGLFGYLVGGAPLKVMTSNTTVFKGVSGLAGLQGATRVRAMGLLLKDSSGSPVLVAGYVEKLQ